MITNENDERIEVGFGKYREFFMNYYGGCQFIFFSTFSMLLISFLKFGADYLVGSWSLSTDQHSNFKIYCILSFAFAFSQSLFVFCRSCAMQLYCLSATKKLHEKMIFHVLRAPINLYFDITPIGRILNKFSEDI